MKNYIGIDLGGTNVRVAKVSHDGKVLREIKSPAFASEGPEKVLANIIKLIRDIPDFMSTKGIGIGVPGPVDTVNGKMILSTNLPGFKGYPIKETIENAVGIPVFVDNDANVAGLAEALVGAGKGLPIVYYITHSTGIGGALIVDGKVVSGKNGHAGEIGNIVIDHDREKINYLNKGAAENEASGTAIIRKGRQQIDSKIESAQEVFTLMASGDEKAIAIIDQMAKDFALMMADIAHVVDPYCFVLGGGVTKSREYYLDKVKEYFKSYVHEAMQSIEIRMAELEEPGIIGAAMLPISFGK
jgi:glucokinase